MFSRLTRKLIDSGKQAYSVTEQVSGYGYITQRFLSTSTYALKMTVFQSTYKHIAKLKKPRLHKV